MTGRNRRSTDRKGKGRGKGHGHNHDNDATEVICDNTEVMELLQSVFDKLCEHDLKLEELIQGGASDGGNDGDLGD